MPTPCPCGHDPLAHDNDNGCASCDCRLGLYAACTAALELSTRKLVWGFAAMTTNIICTCNHDAGFHIATGCVFCDCKKTYSEALRATRLDEDLSNLPVKRPPASVFMQEARVELRDDE